MLLTMTDWVRLNVPANTLQVISGTGFYRSNDPTNSVKAHWRLQSDQVHPTVLTILQQLCSMKQKHTKYTQINTNKWIYVQWNGPSVTKPNPENWLHSSFVIARHVIFSLSLITYLLTYLLWRTCLCMAQSMDRKHMLHVQQRDCGQFIRSTVHPFPQRLLHWHANVEVGHANRRNQLFEILHHATHCMQTRDGPKVRFWHSAEAEGLGRLTERVPNVRPNFGRMLCSRMKQRLLLPSALNGQEM